jgi:hypothetical protein
MGVTLLLLKLRRGSRLATRWMWSNENDRTNMALDGFTKKQKLAMAI